MKDWAREDEHNLFCVPDMLKEFEGHENRCSKTFLSDSYWFQWKNLAMYINYNTFQIEDVDFESTLGQREERPGMTLAEGIAEDDPDYQATYIGEWIVTKQATVAISFQVDDSSDEESQEESKAPVQQEASAQETR